MLYYLFNFLCCVLLSTEYCFINFIIWVKHFVYHDISLSWIVFEVLQYWCVWAINHMPWFSNFDCFLQSVAVQPCDVFCERFGLSSMVSMMGTNNLFFAPMVNPRPVMNLSIQTILIFTEKYHVNSKFLKKWMFSTVFIISNVTATVFTFFYKCTWNSVNGYLAVILRAVRFTIQRPLALLYLTCKCIQLNDPR